MERELDKRLVDPGHYTVYRSGERVWQTATIDRLVDRLPFGFRRTAERLARETGPRGRFRALVELKTVSTRASGWEDGPRLSAQVQVAHQMAVTGIEVGWIAALFGLGEGFQLYPIERDEELIAALIEAEERFLECVRRDIPPPVDGSDGAKAALARIYPVAAGPILSLGREHIELVDRYEQARAAARLAEAEKQAAENELKALIGDAEGIDVEGAEKIYKWTNTRRVDPPRLEERVVEFRTLRGVKR